MTPERFNQVCGSLPHASHVVQFGGADVWKIGGKLFAAMWDASRQNGGVTFKPSPIAFEILRTQPGLRPAPYLASRGLKWIQRFCRRYHERRRAGDVYRAELSAGAGRLAAPGP